MPLRVTNRIPLIPRPAVPEASPPGAVLFDLSGINLANNITPPAVPNNLKIRPVIQQQSEWCWAACVEMVLTHYQRHERQCAIVERKRSFAPTVNVNGAPVPSCGNEARFALETCNVEHVDDVWGRFNIRATLLGAPQTAAERGTFFQMIQAEIAANRPVEVAIDWHENRGGGHAILIVGWTTIDGRAAVLVNDPLPTSLLGITGQSGTIVLTELQRAFGHGVWRQTWRGLAPEVNNV